MREKDYIFIGFIIFMAAMIALSRWTAKRKSPLHEPVEISVWQEFRRNFTRLFTSSFVLVVIGSVLLFYSSISNPERVAALFIIVAVVVSLSFSVFKLFHLKYPFFFHGDDTLFVTVLYVVYSLFYVGSFFYR